MQHRPNTGKKHRGHHGKPRGSQQGLAGQQAVRAGAQGQAQTKDAHLPPVNLDRGPDDGESVLTVRGDWDSLVHLFARANPMSMSHWNPATGELFSLPRGKQRDATALHFEQKLFKDARWVEVPCQESDAGYQQGLAFAEALRPGRGRTEVLAALQGPKPFRALRAVLERHPGLKRRWQLMVDGEAALRLAEFCLSQGWRLGDPRFEDAVLRWLEAGEAMDAAAARDVDTDDFDYLDDDGQPVRRTEVPRAVAQRSVASLSLARRAATGEEPA